MLMLGRVDSWHVIGQQIVYLVLIMLMLLQIFREEASPVPVAPLQPASVSRLGPRLRRRYLKYRSPAVHFLLGTLLNVYTIFFFKSSSLLVSFAFMGVLVLLLLANEAKRL